MVINNLLIFIRSTIFNLFFYLWTFIVLIALLPLLLFPAHIAIIAGRIWAKGIVIAARLLCGIKWRVIGLQYKPQGRAIIASKHQSAWETIVFYLLFDMPVYILKKEVESIPIFGWYVRAIGAISVDRKSGSSALKKMVKDSLNRLNDNRQIVIFPEGSRVDVGKSSKYHSGISAIYAKADTEVTPLALNSGILWGRNSWIKKPGTITFQFLKPIKTGLSKKEFMNILVNDIENASSKLRDK